jgi:hypothetical protein
VGQPHFIENLSRIDRNWVRGEGADPETANLQALDFDLGPSALKIISLTEGQSEP